MFVNIEIELSTMENEKSQGPTGDRVSSNVKEARRIRGYDLKELSKRLDSLGHPINFNGLSRIENRLRRVDSGDLIALALALDVTPDWLLFGPDSSSSKVPLTKAFSTSSRKIWNWATGTEPLLDKTRPEAWRALVRPDSPTMPGIRIPESGSPFIREAADLFRRAEADGIDPKGLLALYEMVKPLSDDQPIS